MSCCDNPAASPPVPLARLQSKRTLNNILYLVMRTLTILPMFLVGALTLVACKKEGCTNPNAINYNAEAKKDDGSCQLPTEGKVTVALNHVWGMSQAPFNLNTSLSHPMNGDDLTFSKVKYYVSNFELKSIDGTWWKHPESYFLVDLSEPSSLELELSGVPVGSYTDIRYMLGVDSTRNVSGAQTGALSTTNGMFWSWNTGYIMAKAEGASPNATSGNFAYHLGGFSGANNILTTKENAFGGTLEVTAKGFPIVKLSSNVARLFHYYGSVSNGETVHMPGASAQSLANGFYGGFNFVEIVQ